jgi:hypothetical protein
MGNGGYVLAAFVSFILAAAAFYLITGPTWVVPGSVAAGASLLLALYGARATGWARVPAWSALAVSAALVALIAWVGLRKLGVL